MNNFICAGRIVADPEVKTLDDGKTVSNITVAVPRSYKNSEGVYETDFIDCTLWGNTANTTAEYCKKGDVIGVKGRLETKTYEDQDGKKVKKMEVIADRITFLATNTKSKDNDQELE